MADLFRTDEIIYYDNDHTYWNLQDQQYTSVTRLIKSIKMPFDDKKISSMMASSLAKETGMSQQEAQKEILNDWKQKKESSIVRGEYVHESFERYLTDGTYDPEMKKPVIFLSEILKEYHRYFPEKLLFSHAHRTAGRCDLILKRQRSKDPVYDIIDHKSNESKGIVYDSVGRKNVIPRHYNRYFLPPFDHLEDCNYTEYCLQLSIYAFLAMNELKIRIGKLNIIFVDNDFIPHCIPAPFMYHEAKLLCELNIQRIKLPVIESPFKQETSTVDLNNIKEEW